MSSCNSTDNLERTFSIYKNCGGGKGTVCQAPGTGHTRYFDPSLDPDAWLLHLEVGDQTPMISEVPIHLTILLGTPKVCVSITEM